MRGAIHIYSSLGPTLRGVSDLLPSTWYCRLTPRHIVRYPEHVRHNGHKNKIVECEFGRPPSRRLGNGQASAICLYTNSWNRVISFGIYRRQFLSCIDDCLVWVRGRVCKSGIDGVERVNASNIGEDTHCESI